VIMKFVIIASLMVRVFQISELKPGGLYYLSTCAILYLEIGSNYNIICYLDRYGYGV
jgi:hypothetical protein